MSALHLAGAGVLGGHRWRRHRLLRQLPALPRARAHRVAARPRASRSRRWRATRNPVHGGEPADGLSRARRGWMTCWRSPASRSAERGLAALPPAHLPQAGGAAGAAAGRGRTCGSRAWMHARCGRGGCRISCSRTWRRTETRARAWSDQLSILQPDRAGERAGADRDRNPAAGLAHLLGHHLPQAPLIGARAARPTVSRTASGPATTWRSCTAPSSPTAGPPAWRASSSSASASSPACARGGMAADQLLEGARRAMRVAQLKRSTAWSTTWRRSRPWAHQPLRRPVRHGLGHHERVLSAG